MILLEIYKQSQLKISFEMIITNSNSYSYIAEIDVRVKNYYRQTSLLLWLLNYGVFSPTSCTLSY